MTQQHQSSPNQKNILDNEAVNATQLRQKAQGDDAGACHHQGACCTHCRPEKSGNQGQKGDIFHHAECVAEPLNAESRIQRTEPGAWQQVVVGLECDVTGCRLWVDDDGEGRNEPSAGSGLGVLGMHERVEALGGRFALQPRHPRGMRVEADFPAEAVRAVEMNHE